MVCSRVLLRIPLHMLKILGTLLESFDTIPTTELPPWNRPQYRTLKAHFFRPKQTEFIIILSIDLE